MPNLSDHDLRQIDPTWQQRQPEDMVRGLLAHALDDLRQACDRLNQNPTESSRPPGSMQPWRRAVAQDAGAGAGAAIEPAPPQTEGEPGARADSPLKAAAASPTPRGPGKPPGAEGFGRTQKNALTATERHRPLCCAACGQALDEAVPLAAWSGWDSVELARLPQAVGLRLEATRATC